MSASLMFNALRKRNFLLRREIVLDISYQDVYSNYVKNSLYENYSRIFQKFLFKISGLRLENFLMQFFKINVFFYTHFLMFLPLIIFHKTISFL